MAGELGRNQCATVIINDLHWRAGGGLGDRRAKKTRRGGRVWRYAASLFIHASLFEKGKTWLDSLNSRESCCI